MQVKYVHPILQKYTDVFIRSSRISGSYFCTSYRFKLDIPFLGNKPICQYDNVRNSSVEYVYDYSALLKAESISEARKIIENTDLFKTYKISKINVNTYNKMMENNAVTAQRLKELKHQDDMLELLVDL